VKKRPKIDPNRPKNKLDLTGFKHREASRGRTKAERKSAVLSNISTSLVKASSAARALYQIFSSHHGFVYLS
jgi:phage tail sheath gpL-like